MSDQVKSQVFGICLAVSTAIGCLAYERLVKNMSYFVVGMVVSAHYVPFWLTLLLIDRGSARDLCKLGEHKWAVLVFALSGVTAPLWYYITRKQSVIVGGIYEMKYIVVLAIIYILFGQSKFTLNTLIGMVLAMTSIYFISKV